MKNVKTTGPASLNGTGENAAKKISVVRCAVFIPRAGKIPRPLPAKKSKSPDHCQEVSRWPAKNRPAIPISRNTVPQMIRITKLDVNFARYAVRNMNIMKAR